VVLTRSPRALLVCAVLLQEYEQSGELKNKAVDLLTLTPETDVEVLVNQVCGAHTRARLVL
jgi:hypothetical protein